MSDVNSMTPEELLDDIKFRLKVYSKLEDREMADEDVLGYLAEALYPDNSKSR